MESNILDSNLIREEKLYTDSDVANSGRRFANSIIDTIVIYIIFFVLLVLSGNQYGENPGFNLIIYLIMIGYYAIMEYAFGKTIGKMVTNTKVITAEGNKPEFKTALIRSICRFIPFDQFSFLGTPCVGWHDKFANSRVVFDR